MGCSLNSARALDPNRMMSQYAREQWDIEGGSAGGIVRAIAQTTDGYLWIGTDSGLVRFDGFNFHAAPFSSTGLFSNARVLDLTKDSDGNLLVRLQGSGILRQSNGLFESVTSDPEPRASYVTAMSSETNGSVLLSDLKDGLLRYRGGKLEVLAQRTSLPGFSLVVSLAETSDGNIWMGTLGTGLFYLAQGRVKNISAGMPNEKINCLLPVGANELWVGTDHGLFRWTGTTMQMVGLSPLTDQVRVLTLLRDRDANVWVGTAQGLLRINALGVSFSDEKELRGDGGINALFEDREGNLWVGGTRGVERIRDSAFVTYSSASGLPSEQYGAIYAGAQNRILFAPANGGLYRFRSGRAEPAKEAQIGNDVVYSISGQNDEIWLGRRNGGLTHLRFESGHLTSRTYTEANGLAQNSVFAAYESRDGTVWAGTLNRGLSRFKDGKFVTYTTANGLSSNTVNAILETRDGTIWIATPNGLNAFLAGHWKTYSSKEGLPSDNVNCLFEDSSGVLWIGTGNGLASLRSEHVEAFSTRPDLLTKQILGLAEAKNGWLWIATANHILRARRDKLLGDELEEGDVREYGLADGLESTEGVKRCRSVVSDSAGNIWFSLRRGLSVVNPSQISENSVSALPHIESITADNNTANLDASVRIPPSPRRITFEYTGLSLAAPGRIRFRYFLENFDNSWSQPVAAREAVYTNLGPGHYRFRLVASNSEGLWNGPETAIAFSVAPAYYQTYWFRFSCIAVSIALLWAVYQMRVHQLQEQEKKFRDAVETMPALAFVADPKGNRTFMNRGWLEYTGLSREEASGWEKAIHPNDLNRITERLRVSERTGQPLDYEARLRRGSDGVYRWFLIRAVPVRDKRGKIAKWCGAATDIEDRKRAEQLQADLTHASRVNAMGELVASISHELAQPLQITTAHAKASLRWLQRDPPEVTEARKGTERIIEAGALASEIIKRLRSLYKKSPPKQELVAINEVTGEMAGMMRGEAREHGVSIRTDLKDDLPMTVADRVQLQQVLMNLMLNGIEAMKDTGGVLTVKSQLGEDGQIEIAVKDTGPGLPVDKIDQIFDGFFTTKPQGSGMGLAICKSIVESHGGRIWANGDGGRGATFHFTLPAPPAQASPPVDAEWFRGEDSA
ncbi:MAG TPA: two-component regulator propeller domain-containing protein [Terracidiphilus sp.]|nr:two-component regulator propeller domain-containing protein [Terracidiphilus sp.]